LLAGRPHARIELARKLARRGYDPEDVEAALSRAAELGYLDDAGFAAVLVRHRAGSRGRRAIAAELASRGVGREVADGALEALDPEIEVDAAMRWARRRAARLTEPSLDGLLEAVGPSLLRHGFSPRVVREACRRALIDQAGRPAGLSR
jgi:regulatory protein